ncbi:hypothetical protein ACLMJK_001950 [Lecanora helva]
MLSPSATSSHLRKRKKHGSSKDNPDAPAAPVPSANVAKDNPIPPSNPPDLPSIDVSKDTPPTSGPKPGAAPSTVTTTVISTVSASGGTSISTTTVHHTTTKTVTVSAGLSSASAISSDESLIPLSGAALTNALLAEQGKSSMSAQSVSSQKHESSMLTSDIPTATAELDRALANHSPATVTVTSTTISHTPTPTCSPLPAPKKHIDPAIIVAIVFGLILLLLISIAMYLMRKFCRMYKSETMYRKQAQMEVNKLREMNGEVGVTVIDRPSKGVWGFKRKESWER